MDVSFILKVSLWYLFFHSISLAVGSCSPEESICWNLRFKHSPCVRILLFLLDFQATVTQTFPSICIPVIAVVLNLHHKLNPWVVTDSSVAIDRFNF